MEKPLVPGKPYWWKAFDDMRVLVKLQDSTPGYVSVQIMTISEAAAIRTGRCAGELIHLAKSAAPLEEVSV